MVTIRHGLLIGLLLVFPPGLAGGEETAPAVESVVEKLSLSGKLTGRRIAVGGFEPADESRTALAERLMGQLELALTRRERAAGFSVVGRGQICQVIRDNKLWIDGRFDPALSRKLGRLAQVDLLTFSSAFDRDSRLSLKFRLIETEGNRAVWEDSIILVPDSQLRSRLSRPAVGDGCGGADRDARNPASGPAPGEALQVRVWADKASYRIGEQVRIRVRVNRDAYVTLVNIGSGGDVVILYPNRFSPGHFVRAGQDVLVPPQGSGIISVIQGPEGYDQIRAIASEEPCSLLSAEIPGRTGTFRSLEPIELRGLLVELRKGRDSVPPRKWAEEVIAVRVTH